VGKKGNKMRNVNRIIKAVLSLLLGWGTLTISQSALAQNGTWATRAPMPRARWNHASCGVNGILYAVGGQCNTNDSVGQYTVDTVEAYDPTTDKWQKKASMPTARTCLGLGVVDGVIYAVGGMRYPNVPDLTFATLEAYHPDTDTWTTKAPMPTVRQMVVVGVLNGVLYVAGGWNGISALTTLEAYDPATDTWTTKAPMPTARFGAAAGVVNGVMYVVGGQVVSDFATLEAYDPSTDTWTTKAPMHTARGISGVGVVRGYLYAIGGNSCNWGCPLSTAEVYDAVSDSRTPDIEP
jgi:N-acetylneuraminic acid mutarotase